MTLIYENPMYLQYKYVCLPLINPQKDVNPLILIKCAGFLLFIYLFVYLY